MMRCARAQEELSAYLDEELSAQERAEVRAHLESCAECRAALEALRRTVESVRTLPRAAAPAGFRDGVMAKLKEAPAEPAESARIPLWRKLWPAAAAVIVALLISQFYPAMKPAHERSRSVARRDEPSARNTEFDKLEPAVVVADGGPIGKTDGESALSEDGTDLLARGPGPEKGYVDNRDPDSLPTRRAGAVEKEGEILLAKAPAESTGPVSNAFAGYAPGQQTEGLDRVAMAGRAPVEILIASADPDHAWQAAQELLEKRGWLAKAQTKPVADAARAKVAAAQPRTIELDLEPGQVEGLRQELTRAGLVILPAPRDQAVQGLRAAVRLEEEQQRAAAQAARDMQLRIRQQSPDLAAQQQGAQVQQGGAQSRLPEAEQRMATALVVLKFVAADPATQDAYIQQTPVVPPPAQGK